mmetsp:Transcript_57107/g.121370  ORF Transcript_57107/g.121370 Transcript_57107/m.121370 type:complete len:634 (+) Transcript_57107:163-2064(+)|eukprot:CAMPEP_0206447206 /NCGR_PEP_ID=MMETSP0324_2-20121206/16639_1 /ASSEMBLY_ACC=CAM_ASM_000836 /TAXON_ID=2866 /ORGANISM="Crypthecodinium cohnii, Strain Seligo" /LENGTH=633 /DNA_ID=CAMNT_0053915915 /DNA_START=163 /DNA_END=2064 /DNA_ORIENTATION=-
MFRLQRLSSHVLAGADSSPLNLSLCPCSATAEVSASPTKSSKQNPVVALRKAFVDSVFKLQTTGELPEMTLFELNLLIPKLTSSFRMSTLDKLLVEAEGNGSLAALEVLPGPWKDCKTREDKHKLILIDQTAWDQGVHHQLYAGYQLKYGGRGLSSNIAVPSLVAHSGATAAPSPGRKIVPDRMRVISRVILSDPEDSERISRIHVRKEPNFGLLFDSVISTTDNDHWKAQRDHLNEVFLPQSSLAKILPVSLERAKRCADRLAELSNATPSVDMSDFLLHEAQAQLQLALLGMPSDFMEATNSDIRQTFMGHPEATVGKLSQAMKDIMKQAREDTTSRVPSDFLPDADHAGEVASGCPVRAPLSRALQTGKLNPSTEYGNMLIILFAGHDTTGHTMTWVLFELSRRPELQRAVQKEVDQFFAFLNGRDPTYQDLRKFDLLDRVITETLRFWPAVANGTFRQLHFPDTVKGANGEEVTLPKGTYTMIQNWSRHRNPELWGPDANSFNPHRDFSDSELSRVGCPMAARNPQSDRFSPFAHNPRSCLGKNFAQMEMRLILSYLLKNFSFDLAAPYQPFKDSEFGAALPESSATSNNFRGVNRGGTMGPLDVEKRGMADRPLIALKLDVRRRSDNA